MPLAAAYLKLFAQRKDCKAGRSTFFPHGSATCWETAPWRSAILARGPALVGFTCYLWNIQRTICIARQLKAAPARIQILLGGPEITADNRWVLEEPSVDLAAIGEGEQTFVDCSPHCTPSTAARVPALAGILTSRVSPGCGLAAAACPRRGAQQISTSSARPTSKASWTRPRSIRCSWRPRAAAATAASSATILRARFDLSHVAWGDREQLAARLPARRQGDLPPGPHAQSAAGLRGLAAVAGAGQSRSSVHLFGDCAPRASATKLPGCSARPTSRRWKSGCNGSIPRRKN